MSLKKAHAPSMSGAVHELLSSDRSCAVDTHAGEAELRLGPVIAKAVWDNDWFTLSAGIQRCQYGAPSFDVVQNALHRNALISNVRHVYARRANEMRIVAEFPLSDLTPQDRRLIENRKSRAKAALSAAGRFERPRDASALWAPAAAGAASIAVRSLLDESDWRGVSGEQDNCRADLELRYTRQQATVTRQPNGILLSADMLDGPDEPSPLCMHAASLYLLMCASDTRLVAATVDMREPAFIPRLQVMLPAGATAGWLHYGLAALSVAYDSAAEAVEALSYDENIARRYLTTHTTPAAE